MDTFREHDRAVVGEVEREHGVVGLAEVRVLDRRRVGQEHDLAAPDLVDGRERVVGRADERAAASRVAPRTLPGRVDRVHTHEGGVDLRPRARPVGAPRRRLVAEVVQVERRSAADDEPPARGHELQQRGGVVVRERLGIDGDDGRAGVGRVVGEGAPLHAYRVPEPVQQRRVRGQPVGCRRVRRTGDAARLAAADRLIERLREQVQHDQPADDDGEADHDPARPSVVHARSDSERTRGQSRRAASRSEPAGSAPPYATDSNVRARSSNVSDPRARRTSLVVSDGRYSIAPRVAEPQQAGPETQTYCTRQVAFAFGLLGHALEHVGIFALVLSARAHTTAVGRARDVAATRDDRHARDDCEHDANRDRDPQPGGDRQSCKPVERALDAIADPLHRTAERTRRRAGVKPAVGENVLRLASRGVGIDCLASSHEAVRTPPGAAANA